ncbi:MAG: lysoplasmalogenase [Saprospiraceae bacterium]
MKSRILLSCFFLVVIAELYGEATQNINIIYIAKPLLMISLSAYFLHSTIKNRNRFSTLILLGLIFSIGGDTFLMFDGSFYFMLGLGCFLITHLFYITAFINYQSLSNGFIRQKPWLVLPFLIYLAGILSYLWNDLADMKIPVIVYSSVICLMSVATLNLKSQLPKSLFIALFIGVLLFMFSDSVIALNKFKASTLTIPYHHIIIMVTYITAQYLITKNTIEINKSI